MGYQCIHCLVTLATKREFVSHLRAEHRPDFAPWICPICQFQCKYGLIALSQPEFHKTVPVVVYWGDTVQLGTLTILLLLLL